MTQDHDISATQPSAVRTSYALLAALLAVVFFLVYPSDCSALTLSVDEVDSYELASFDLSVSSQDPTGTVILAADGRTLDVQTVFPGESVRYEDIDAGPGTHEVTAILRGREGVALSNPVVVNVWTEPDAPTLSHPSSYAAQYTNVSVTVGVQTTMLSMYVNGKHVHTREVAPSTLLSMPGIELRQGMNTIELVAENPLASTRASFQVRRLDYPWPTCIIIDKSDYRLYWIRDGVLVKAYPIAVGKSYTPTPVAIWRIDAKYNTDPASVYGPRKMRLFRQTSYGYTYTAYAIHGTNQPWVIGTMASHGCIRMYNSDVLELFPQVPLGTMVQTRQ